ncbi:MAG TPA: ABC transporter permease [Vicinamibacterales bacterium]|nr:ABC transporter permease [Vicinamibacterales bacterium]
MRSSTDDFKPPFLESLFRDLRYGARMLRKSPGFTLIAVITLAVGIGVNTAVFSVVYGLLLRPLPYLEPERLATIGFRTGSPASVDGRAFLAIRDGATTVDVAASGSSFGGGVNLVAGDRAANVGQGRVSAGYFAVLGIEPFIGREFNADEDRAGGQPVAVLSHDLWTRVFKGDPEMIGRTIQLRGEPYMVVGVMPEGFTTGTETDVWTPLQPSTTGEGGGTNYGMILRLRPGVGWEQATAEVTQLGWPRPTDGAGNDPAARRGLLPLQQGQTAEIRQPLLMLWGAVGLVLLIACVNVAGLLIARSGMRTREIATRMALGSGRRAVIRQLLVESAVLALAGGALGAGLGAIVLEALKTLAGSLFPLAYPVVLDWRVLALTLAIALLTSLVFGLVPALQASRVDVHATLTEAGTRSIAGGIGGWARRLLVVTEVAIGVVLLVSAGLLARTFMQLRTLDPGFAPSGVITATVSLQDARYESAEKVNLLFSQSLDRIRQLPGVEAAGVSLGLPYTRLLNMGFKPLDGTSTIEPGGAGLTNLVYVTPGYFEALGLPVRRGRTFVHSDSAAGLPVAIVNEEFAARYYRGQEMLGRQVNTAGKDRLIVAVVGNARATSSGFGDYSGPLVVPPIVYVPAAQTTDGFLNVVHTWFSPAWVVRATGSLESVAAGIRQAIGDVDPLLPIARLETMSDVQSRALAMQRFMMSLMLGLAVVALLLAAIGIHGLIASSVTERRRELGIRLALGATSGQVMRVVVLPGVLLALAGVIAGTGAAFAAARLLQAFLWGVAPTDAVTFGVVILTLLIVAAFASFVPALRVLRLDPATTLRAE